MTSVGIICIARKEHDYIKEFVEYHRKIGVSRFVIYDNGLSDDIPLKSLFPNDSDVDIYRWEGEQAQSLVYTHFISKMLPRTIEAWWAFIDVDEFIVPVKHKTLPAFLEEYGHLGAIGLNWRLFGTNGRIAPSGNSVIENYTESIFNQHVKTLSHRSRLSIPIRCIHNINHMCRNLKGEVFKSAFSLEDNTDVIRLNHYYTKSWSEFMAKIERGRADVKGKRTVADNFDLLLSNNKTPDFAIFDVLDVPHPDEHVRATLEDIEMMLNESDRQALKAYLGLS